MRQLLAIGPVLAAAAVASGCSAGFAGSPTYVTDAGATINGSVATTDGGPTSYWVEYGTSPSYDHQSAHRSKTVPANSIFSVSIPIAGLSPSTTYHYRLCAERCGDDATFKTDGPGGRSGLVFSSNRGLGNGGNAVDIVALRTLGSDPTDLTNSEDGGDQSPSWSPDARRIAFTRYSYSAQGTFATSAQIYAMDADGTDVHPLTSDSAFHLVPAWSPDGKRIAYSHLQNSYEIFVMDADGSHQHNLTNGAAPELQPAWSPDGTRIAFSRSPGSGEQTLYVMSANGTDRKPLTGSNYNEGTPAWSPDGTKIAYVADLGGSLGWDVFVIPADGGTALDVTQRAGNEFGPTWSPDGSKIAFAADNGDIAVIDAAGGTPVNLTSDAFADLEPVWSPRP